ATTRRGFFLGRSMPRGAGASGPARIRKRGRANQRRRLAPTGRLLSLTVPPCDERPRRRGRAAIPKPRTDFRAATLGGAAGRRFPTAYTLLCPLALSLGSPPLRESMPCNCAGPSSPPCGP